jgi:hypothetical protein
MTKGKRKVVGTGFEDDVAAAPPMNPKESMSDYMQRTGIKNAGIVFRKYQDQQNNWTNSDTYKNMMSKNAADQQAFDKSNDMSNPINVARAKAVSHAFVGAIGNEMGYRVAALAKSYVDKASDVISPILGVVAPGITGDAYDFAKHGLDFIYDQLGIPEDLSNQAANDRIIQAVKDAQSQYGEGILGDNDYHLLDLLFQYPNPNQKPSDVIRQSSLMNDMQNDTSRQMQGLKLQSNPLTPYANLNKNIVDRLDSLYEARLKNPLVSVAMKSDPSTRQYKFNQCNKIFPPPVPSQLIPQWLQQGGDIIEDRGKSKQRRRQMVENTRKKIQGN